MNDKGDKGDKLVYVVRESQVIGMESWLPDPDDEEQNNFRCTMHNAIRPQLDTLHKALEAVLALAEQLEKK